ncbi:MAG: helix-turn-helix domain-containing protein [Clostridiales bacterium]|nr:helix-turn-helix domain-containing protein [Clostridiales bacterium]
MLICNGNSVKSIRRERNVNVSEMANLLNLKTIQSYYKKESGKRKFSLDEAKKIADFFGMDIEDIFFQEASDERF